MAKKSSVKWGEERGSMALETLALAAVVLLLIAGTYTILTTWGTPVIKESLNSSVERQIERWHDAGTESFFEAFIP